MFGILSKDMTACLSLNHLFILGEYLVEINTLYKFFFLINLFPISVLKFE